MMQENNSKAQFRFKDVGECSDEANLWNVIRAIDSSELTTWFIHVREGSNVRLWAICNLSSVDETTIQKIESVQSS